jgi:hypothetical protein
MTRCCSCSSRALTAVRVQQYTNALLSKRWIVLQGNRQQVAMRTADRCCQGKPSSIAAAYDGGELQHVGAALTMCGYALIS